MRPFRRFLRTPEAIAGSILLAALIAMALSASLLFSGDPQAIAGPALLPPLQDWSLPLGTDRLGRNVLAELFHGARTSLAVGLAAAAAALAIGSVVGTLAGFAGGLIDEVLMRVTDAFQTVPSFLLALAFVSVVGPSLGIVVIAIALGTWTGPARVARAEVLSIRERDYVAGARVIGMHPLAIAFREVLPNALPPVLAMSSVIVAAAILTEAALSFLGLGDPNRVTWGGMISEGRAVLRTAPFLSIVPGIALVLTVLGVYLAGEGIVETTAVRSALATIRDLTVTYRRDGSDVAALKGISFDIMAGERLAIIGESGSGKSTLALTIAGLLPASARIAGSIDWFLRQPSASGAKAERQPFKSELSPLLGRDIGFVFQDPSASLDPVMTIGKQIAEVARTHLGLTWSQSYAWAKSLLQRVRLPDPDSALRAFPHQLSGGQKQRVAIAAAIAAGPKLLIADEATSALDTIVQAEIVALIRRLVAEDGMTLLFISHDIALAAELAERIAVFRHGQLVELGTTARIVDAPAQPYTRALLDAHIGLDAKPLLNRARRHA